MDAALGVSGESGRPTLKPPRERSLRTPFPYILKGERGFGQLSQLSFFELFIPVVGAHDKR